MSKATEKSTACAFGRAAIEDHSYFEFIFTAPKEWTQISAPLDKFVQPSWGKQVPRSYKDVTKVGFLALTAPNDEDFSIRFTDLEFVAEPHQKEKSAKTRILFIGKDPDHPYGSHMYMHTCGVLAKCVELMPGVEAIVSKGWPKDKKDVADLKAIVVYTNPAAEFLLDSPDRDAIEAAFKSGVGLTTIHWASTVKKENYDRLGPVWLRYTGGTWISNVGLSDGPSLVKQLLPDHPISRGWKEFELNDEYYLNPVLKVRNRFCKCVKRRGKM